MSSSTSRLQLTKLADSENFSNTVLNANWDKVDNGYGTLNSQIASTNGGVPKRQVGAISPNGSATIAFSSDYSGNTEFALLALNYSGNAIGGCALIFLGRGTGTKIDLIGQMTDSNYTLTYSNSNTWTITNNSAESTLFYTALISK